MKRIADDRLRLVVMNMPERLHATTGYAIRYNTASNDFAANMAAAAAGALTELDATFAEAYDGTAQAAASALRARVVTFSGTPATFAGLLLDDEFDASSDDGARTIERTNVPRLLLALSPLYSRLVQSNSVTALRDAVDRAAKALQTAQTLSDSPPGVVNDVPLVVAERAGVCVHPQLHRFGTRCIKQKWRDNYIARCVCLFRFAIALLIDMLLRRTRAVCIGTSRWSDAK